MGRRTTIRALFASCAAVALLGMVVAAASDDPPPTSVRATGGESGGRTSPTSEAGAPEETSTSTSAAAATGTRTTTSSSGGRTRTAWGRTLSTGEPTATAGSGGTTTTTQQPGSPPTTSLPELTPPAAPDEDHIVLWGRVVDEAGKPVRDVCVGFVRVLPPGTPNVVVRTKADGSYVMVVDVVNDMPVPGGIGARLCPGDTRYLLPAHVTNGSPLDGSMFPPGSSTRSDMWMPFAATTVDIAFVDPAGRPVLGICGNTDTGEETWAVDERGHVLVERPPYLSLHVGVHGACGSGIGMYDAAYSFTYQDFTLHAGANSITYVVPWQSADRAGEAIAGFPEVRFDLFSTSTEASEPDPSCIGAFSHSRWFRFSQAAGGGSGYSVRNGGSMRTTLSRGGTFAVWAFAPSGALVSLGCGRAGTSVPFPSGHSEVWVQVIPDDGPAQSGTVRYEITPQVPL